MGDQSAHRVFRRGGDALQFVKPVSLLLGASRNELLGEKLTKRRILLAPAEAHQGEHRRVLLLLGGRPGPPRPADRVTSEEDKMRDTVGVTYRVGDRNRTPLGNAEQ